MQSVDCDFSTLKVLLVQSSPALVPAFKYWRYLVLSMCNRIDKTGSITGGRIARESSTELESSSELEKSSEELGRVLQNFIWEMRGISLC